MERHDEFLKVISASRRVDLAGAYPDPFVELLRQKAPPERTHTLVIWTKNPMNLLQHASLKNQVAKYESVFLHLTITGMGGSILEPRVPKPEQVFPYLRTIVDLAGGGAHVRLRFDPIVHIRFADGSLFTNLPRYPEIARGISKSGITNISISWMQVYSKVRRNLKLRNMSPVEIPEEEWLEEMAFLQKVSSEFGITLHGCCVQSMPMSRCIDGLLLSEIHPRKINCSKAKARGQRELCGCTESLDIGWYEPCRHGCVYCYANPLMD